MEEIDNCGFWENQRNKIKNVAGEWATLLTLLGKPAIFLSLGVAVIAV